MSSYIYKLEPLEPTHSTKDTVEPDVPVAVSDPESVNRPVLPENDPNRFALIDAPAACRPGEATDGRGKCKKIADFF